MSQKDTKLANRILWGLVVGAAAGALTVFLARFYPPLLSWAIWLSTNALDPLGQVFLRLLFFVVIPLVFASLAGGVLQLGELKRLGPLAARTFGLFFLNMSIALVIGLVMMNVLTPGSQLDSDTQARLSAEYRGDAEKHVEKLAELPQMTPMTVVDMFMPRNLLGAFVGNQRDLLGEVLPLILFAILVGAAGLSLPAQPRQKLQAGLETITALMTTIVHFALRLAPYAVPALIYSVLVKVGLDILVALGVFVVGCVVALLVHLFGTMSIWLRLWTHWRPFAFFSAIREVLVTAFSTSSSNATLPTALATARERLNIAPATAGFVLPLGTTINMSGTALFEGCVVLFIAQIFGVDLTLAQQVTLLLLAVLSAVAVAGIPGGSLPVVAGLLVTFGIPPEGIGIVLGVDRLLDMTRTMVNVGSDVVTCAVVDARTRKAELRHEVSP